MLKNLIRGLAIAGVALGIATFIGVSRRDADQDQAKKAQAEREQQAARAVRVLPPGTEDAWLAYVDRQVAATITRRGNTIQVVGLVGFLPQMVIMSINMPYQVNCDQSFQGLSVDFGYGDKAVSVPITGSMTTILNSSQQDQPLSRQPQLAVDPAITSAQNFLKAMSSDQSPSGEPQLGVDPASIAAANLIKVLCRRIADRVQAIIGQQ